MYISKIYLFTINYFLHLINLYIRLSYKFFMDLEVLSLYWQVQGKFIFMPI